MTTYSNSRLKTFQTCPLKFKFTYIDEIKVERESIEAFLGQRFHEVMEKIYTDINTITYSIDELMEYYEHLWDKFHNDNVVITRKNKSIDDYRNAGKQFIRDYYTRYYPFNQGTVVGIEKQINMDFNNDGKYVITGFIDRIDKKENGLYEIHDYKTSSSLPSQQYLDKDRQLSLYHMGIRNIFDDIKDTRLIWHYAAFDKEIVSSRTEEQLENIKSSVITLIDEIESTTVFIPKESGLCNWCDYQQYCDLRNRK